MTKIEIPIDDDWTSVYEYDEKGQLIDHALIAKNSDD